jgi:hypothetical protein
VRALLKHHAIPARDSSFSLQRVLPQRQRTAASVQWLVGCHNILAQQAIKQQLVVHLCLLVYEHTYGTYESQIPHL